MLYVVKLTVPANTPKTKPTRAEIKVHEDMLTRVEAYFPPGCMGLVGSALYYGRMMVWPSREGEWVIGDAETVKDDFMYHLPEKPCKLIVKAYNEDTTFSHSVIWRLSAQMREYGEWQKATVGSYKTLKDLAEFFGLV